MSTSQLSCCFNIPETLLNIVMDPTIGPKGFKTPALLQAGPVERGSLVFRRTTNLDSNASTAACCQLFDQTNEAPSHPKATQFRNTHTHTHSFLCTTQNANGDSDCNSLQKKTSQECNPHRVKQIRG